MVVTVFIVNLSHCCAYPSLMSAIFTAVSFANISHRCGLSVVDVGHRRGCHPPSLMLAIVAAISVVDVGHHRGQYLF